VCSGAQQWPDRDDDAFGEVCGGVGEALAVVRPEVMERWGWADGAC
jgi:hypothetical protein